jgi:hypothetical protein
MSQRLRIQSCSDPDFVDGLIFRLREQIGWKPGMALADVPSVQELIHTPDVLTLGAWVDDVLCGAWLIHPHKGRCHHVHSLLLPPARGRTGIELGKLGMKWIWEHTGWDELWTTHATARKDVRFFAKQVGFEVVEEFVDDGTPTTLLVIHRPKENQ